MDLIRDCLGFQVGSAYRRLDRFFNRAFQPLGLTHAHAQVLMCLLQAGEMRPADVAGRTGFEQSTVSRLVKELTRRKLVRRRKHPDDGRSQLLEPGARGLALRGEIEAILRQINGVLHRDLTQADLDSLEQTLRAATGRLP